MTMLSAQHMTHPVRTLRMPGECTRFFPVLQKVPKSSPQSQRPLLPMRGLDLLVTDAWGLTPEVGGLALPGKLRNVVRVRLQRRPAFQHRLMVAAKGDALVVPASLLVCSTTSLLLAPDVLIEMQCKEP